MQQHRVSLVLSGFVSALLIGFCGCGGSVDGHEPGPTTTTSSSLSGTWDVVGAESGHKPNTGLIIIASDRLTVTFGDGSLEFAAPAGGSPSLLWTERSIPESLTFAHTPGAAVDLGILPLVLGGHIDITDPLRPAASCTADLTASSITAGCSGTHRSRVSGIPGLEDRIIGTRTSKLASSFGELGGTWTFDNTSGSHSEASFSGNTVKLPLSVEGKDLGTMTIVFSDGLASGTTHRGIEFTARRR